MHASMKISAAAFFAISILISVTIMGTTALASSDISSDEKEISIGLSILSNDLTTPVVTSASPQQIYKKVVADGVVYATNGKAYAKGNRNYAAWTKSNPVEIIINNPTETKVASGLYTQYYLQRSTNPNSGFVKIDENTSMPSVNYSYIRGSESNVGNPFITPLGNGRHKIVDYAPSRGTKYYYRVVAVYSYTDQATGKAATVEKPTGVITVRTAPKTFVAKNVKVRSGNRWKAKAVANNKKSHKYRITWKKRSDIDGYFVYKLVVKEQQLKKIKSWQYVTSDMGFGLYKSPADYWYPVTAKKWCKKVKNLKAGATSFTFTCKDNIKGRNHTAYAVVPFVKQNGKAVIGDAKKVYFASKSYGVRNSHVLPMGKDFKDYFQFPLM